MLKALVHATPPTSLLSVLLITASLLHPATALADDSAGPVTADIAVPTTGPVTSAMPLDEVSLLLLLLMLMPSPNIVSTWRPSRLRGSSPAA